MPDFLWTISCGTVIFWSQSVVASSAHAVTANGQSDEDWEVVTAEWADDLDHALDVFQRPNDITGDLVSCNEKVLVIR